MELFSNQFATLIHARCCQNRTRVKVTTKRYVRFCDVLDPISLKASDVWNQAFRFLSPKYDLYAKI